MEESNVEAWMTTMQQEFGQIRAEWQDVQQAPIINGRLLRALRDTQVEQGKDIAVLKTDVAVLKTDVAVLKTDVAVLKTDVAVLKTDVAELKLGQHTIISMLDHLIAREN